MRDAHRIAVVMENIGDLILDNPHACHSVGVIIASLIHEDRCTQEMLEDILTDHVETPHRVAEQVLGYALKTLQHEDASAQQWWSEPRRFAGQFLPKHVREQPTSLDDFCRKYVRSPAPRGRSAWPCCRRCGRVLRRRRDRALIFPAIVAATLRPVLTIRRTASSELCRKACLALEPMASEQVQCLCWRCGR